MEVKFNVTGKERKALVNAIAEITETTATYKGVPSCAYEVDYYTIDRFGTLSFDDMADSEEIESLLDKLEQKGFCFESTDTDEPKETINSEPVGLTVTIPINKVATCNIRNLLETKGNLIKKALGISELPIEIAEDKISFPWFTEGLDADEVKAYTNFISSLCKMSMKQKRINVTKAETENEKYTFRCFLLRLGFIGDKYKGDRKILLSKLTGSASFKKGTRKGGAK